MTPIQVTVRFSAEVGRAWSFRPVGNPPRVGAITPRPFAFAPDAAEAADGTFEVALLTTDGSWAWQVRDPDNIKRTVAVTGSGPVQYAALADVDAADPASIAAPAFTPVAPSPALPTATTLEQTPLWLLDVVRDLARRQADLESRVGTPAGMTPIGTTEAAVDAYINGFITPLIGDCL